MHASTLRADDVAIFSGIALSIASIASAALGGPGWLDYVLSGGTIVALLAANFHTLRLDDQPADLLVEAERLSGDANQVLYRFAVSAAGQPLLDGRAAVILDAGALA